jgi:N6-adenosine-specific RNA methylase IME4
MPAEADQRMLYRTIVADPPWQPELGGGWGARADKGRGQRFYRTMPLEDIKALEVPAAPQSHLYIWCLSQHIDWGYDVCRAWGFDPVMTFAWCKDGLGVGRFRCNTEHIIAGRKGPRHGNPFGRGGRHAQATAGTWFTWPRGRHSEKPAEFYQMVTGLSPGPYLEMFARVRRPGWHAWGNEVGADVAINGWAPAAARRPAPVAGGRSPLLYG